ncbi:MAG TPA: cell wall hydrolase [Alphaproteobacteria bacterium]|nr:cell wall hydrolase [Alphaproteobacteria bacterium]
MQADFMDLEFMSRTIWGEARGEGTRGKYAVAYVIMNRARANRKHYGGGTLKGVCLKPWQFSCWNKNDPNLPKLKAVELGDPVFNECVKTALDVMQAASGPNYGLVDPSQGATHYYVNGSPTPAWRGAHKPCAIIGRHLFFKGID